MKLIALLKDKTARMTYEKVHSDGTLFTRYLTWADTVEDVVVQMLQDIEEGNPIVSLYLDDYRIVATDLEMNQLDDKDNYGNILYSRMLLGG